MKKGFRTIERIGKHCIMILRKTNEKMYMYHRKSNCSHSVVRIIKIDIIARLEKALPNF